MELDMGTRDYTVKSIGEWVSDHVTALGKRMTELEKATTVEGLLLAKQALLKACSDMPMGYCHCYFCVLHDSDCQVCEYRQVHGRCVNQNDGDHSDYDDLSSAQRALRAAIDHYYRDEVYGEEEEKEEDAKVYKDIIAKTVEVGDELENHFIDADGDDLRCIQTALRTNYQTQGAFYKAAFGVNEDEADEAGWHPEDTQFDEAGCDGWIQFLADKGIIRREKVTFETSLDAEELGKFILACKASGVDPNDAYLPHFLG